ncbi:MAG TPA: GlcNAc-PI de-N-acetylase [Acidimicrobiales bacterium]|nr:GlcNAc-PI de-N-acetylase [Acidimicrobiales bacterium]
MATLVTFHAHPDDEAIATGGTMARAAAAGHRVVLVVATRGERGQVADDFLPPGRTLGQVREAETRAAAEILGVDRVEFLGYEDSGMETGEGEPTTAVDADESCFALADRTEAARRLASILAEESADVLTCYDSHGGYRHPDHIAVHRVGHAAAALAGTPRLYEVTMNRTHIEAMRAELEALTGEAPPRAADDEFFGTPDDEINTAVDVSEVIDTKRAAMAAHASQISAESFFLSMPLDHFAAAFGTEWYIRTTPPFEGDFVTDRENWLFPGEPTP